MKEGWRDVAITYVEGAASRNTITRRPFDESEVFFRSMLGSWFVQKSCGPLGRHDR